MRVRQLGGLPAISVTFRGERERERERERCRTAVGSLDRERDSVVHYRRAVAKNGAKKHAGLGELATKTLRDPT